MDETKYKWHDPVLREILHLRNYPLLGYLRMRQVFRKG